MKTPVPSPGRLLATACLAAVALTPGSALAASATDVQTSITSAVDYIKSQQNATTGALGSTTNANGSFGGDYALSALAAAGVHPADVTRAGGTQSAQDNYATSFGALTNPSSTAILFGYAAGIDPQRITAQTNLVANLAAFYNPTSSGDLEGSFANGAMSTTTFSVLAFARVGAPQLLLDRMNAYVRGQRHADGGWNIGRVTTEAARNANSSVDQTGAVLASLCETGADRNDPDVRAGLTFIKGKQDPATGGVGNADSTSWVISGLNACGIDAQGSRWTTSQGKTLVDGLLVQQLPSGAFGFAGNASFYSTQNGLRALAGEAFSADPPRRVTSTDPRFRLAPAVAPDTVVPHVLIIDDGAGDVRACKVSAIVDAPLPDLLNAAQAASQPTACVASSTSTNGALTELNGQTGTWRLRLDRAPETAALAQPVAFGQTVTLRRVAPTPGAGQDGAPGQNGGPGVAGPIGPAGADGQNGAAGAPGASGPIGPKGTTGPQGTPGPKGEQGSRGRTGRRGIEGRTARLSCRRARKGRHVSCRLTASTAASRSSRVRLTRGGKLYARGTLKRLVARRTVRRGGYTLRITDRRGTTKLVVRVR